MVKQRKYNYDSAQLRAMYHAVLQRGTYTSITTLHSQVAELLCHRVKHPRRFKLLVKYLFNAAEPILTGDKLKIRNIVSEKEIRSQDYTGDITQDDDLEYENMDAEEKDCQDSLVLKGISGYCKIPRMAISVPAQRKSSTSKIRYSDTCKKKVLTEKTVTNTIPRCEISHRIQPLSRKNECDKEKEKVKQNQSRKDNISSENTMKATKSKQPTIKIPSKKKTSSITLQTQNISHKKNSPPEKTRKTILKTNHTQKPNTRLQNSKRVKFALLLNNPNNTTECANDFERSASETISDVLTPVLKPRCRVLDLNGMTIRYRLGNQWYVLNSCFEKKTFPAPKIRIFYWKPTITVLPDVTDDTGTSASPPLGTPTFTRTSEPESEITVIANDAGSAITSNAVLDDTVHACAITEDTGCEVISSAINEDPTREITSNAITKDTACGIPSSSHPALNPKSFFGTLKKLSNKRLTKRKRHYEENGKQELYKRYKKSNRDYQEKQKYCKEREKHPFHKRKNRRHSHIEWLHQLDGHVSGLETASQDSSDEVLLDPVANAETTELVQQRIWEEKLDNLDNVLCGSTFEPLDFVPVDGVSPVKTSQYGIGCVFHSASESSQTSSVSVLDNFIRSDKQLQSFQQDGIFLPILGVGNFGKRINQSDILDPSVKSKDCNSNLPCENPAILQPRTILSQSAIMESESIVSTLNSLETVQSLITSVQTEEQSTENEHKNSGKSSVRSESPAVYGIASPIPSIQSPVYHLTQEIVSSPVTSVQTKEQSLVTWLGSSGRSSLSSESPIYYDTRETVLASFSPVTSDQSKEQSLGLGNLGQCSVRSESPVYHETRETVLLPLTSAQTKEQSLVTGLGSSESELFYETRETVLSPLAPVTSAQSKEQSLEVGSPVIFVTHEPVVSPVTSVQTSLSEEPSIRSESPVIYVTDESVVSPISYVQTEDQSPETGRGNLRQCSARSKNAVLCEHTTVTSSKNSVLSSEVSRTMPDPLPTTSFEAERRVLRNRRVISYSHLMSGASSTEEELSNDVIAEPSNDATQSPPSSPSMVPILVRENDLDNSVKEAAPALPTTERVITRSLIQKMNSEILSNQTSMENADKEEKKKGGKTKRPAKKIETATRFVVMKDGKRFALRLKQRNSSFEKKQRMKKCGPSVADWQCRYCSYKGHDRPDVKDHILRKHTYRCYRCKKTYKTIEEVMHHRVMHNPEVHHCTLCKKTFLSANMQRHKQTQGHQVLEEVQRTTVDTMLYAITGKGTTIKSVICDEVNTKRKAKVDHVFHAAIKANANIILHESDVLSDAKQEVVDLKLKKDFPSSPVKIDHTADEEQGQINRENLSISDGADIEQAVTNFFHQRDYNQATSPPAASSPPIINNENSNIWDQASEFGNILQPQSQSDDLATFVQNILYPEPNSPVPLLNHDRGNVPSEMQVCVLPTFIMLIVRGTTPYSKSNTVDWVRDPIFKT